MRLAHWKGHGTEGEWPRMRRCRPVPCCCGLAICALAMPALRLAASIALPPSVFRKASVLARNALISPIVVSLSAQVGGTAPAPCPAAPDVAWLIFGKLLSLEWTAFSSRPRAWVRVLLGDALVLRLSGSA